MKTRITLALSFAALLTAGCGSRSETPPPKPAGAVAEKVEKSVEKSSVEPSTTPSKERSPQTSPEVSPQGQTTKVEPPPKPGVDSGVRGLVQKLARKEGGKWTVDEKAQAELEKLGPQGVDQIMPLLADESTDVRRGAAYHLLPLAASRDDLAGAYNKLLEDSDATIRGIGLSAVGQFKPAQKAAAAPALAKVLAHTDADDQHRSMAVRLLGDLGGEAAPLLPQLSKAATDDASPKVRSSALLAISRVAEPAATVEAMTKALADQDQGVRLMAVQRLRELGRAAEPALNDLAKLLEDKDEKIRRTSGEALVRIGKPSVPALTTALDSKSRDAREVALTALGKMGDLAKPALPAIRKRLTDSDPKVKDLARRTVLELESL